MQRRQFITLAGVAAIATQRLASTKLAGSKLSTWQPDGIGSLARIGVLTPDFDPVPESEMWAMAPRGVSIHASRVTWKWNHDPREFAEALQLDNAVDQLAALKPQAIAYAFTSSSYALGAEAEGAQRTRLEKRTGGVSVILTCIAATEALRTIGAQRMALIHPVLRQNSSRQAVSPNRRQLAVRAAAAEPKDTLDGSMILTVLCEETLRDLGASVVK